MKTIISTSLNTQLKSEWELLWKKSPNASYANSPQWFLSVLDAFKYQDYAIISVYHSNELIGIGALVKDKRYGLSYYTVAPGDYVCGTPFLLNFQNKATVKVFTQALLSLGTVHLENVPEQVVKALLYRNPNVQAIDQTINLYFPIIKDEKGIVHVPKRSRLTNRIKGREDEFIVESYDGRSEKGMAIAYEIDEMSSKQEKGYSTFGNQVIRNFYSTLEKRFKKHFLVTVIYFQDKPIAYYIGFIVGKTYFWSQNAFISEYSQFSPGKVLLVRLIDYLGEHGVTVLNFGSGDYRMKRLLTDEYDKLFYVTISSSRFVRSYIRHVTSTKNKVYDKLHSNTRLYSFYKKVKQLIS